MDIPNPTRHRPNKPSPSERFLGPYPHAPPVTTSNLNSSPDVGDDFTEDDIFWTTDFAAEPNHHHHQNIHHNNVNNNHSTPPSSASSTLRRHHKGFSQPESFGILAALPDRDDASSPNHRSHSHFFHKASASSSSSTSPSYAQMIPSIPKPPPLQDHHHHHRSSFSSSFKYQSAPVNIPVLMRKKYELQAVADEEEDDGEMLPPHEIVARSSAQSPEVAYSVLEGVGRTLKGRDLRRVRNAVWRRTGFLD